MAIASRRPLLVVECPVDGGVLATRWGWPRQPGLVELAVEDSPAPGLWEQARPWSGASRLLAADPSAITMHRSGALRFVADHLASFDAPMVIDLGRLQPDETTTRLLAACDRLWLMLDPTAEQATTATTWRPLLERACTVEVVLAAGRRSEGRYGRRELSEALGWPVIAELDHDRRAAAALRGLVTPASWLLHRLPLIRQAAELLGRINPDELDESRVEERA